VSRDRIAEQDIFLARACADVMDEQRHAAARLPVAEDADAGQLARQTCASLLGGKLVPWRAK